MIYYQQLFLLSFLTLNKIINELNGYVYCLKNTDEQLCYVFVWHFKTIIYLLRGNNQHD